MIINNSFDTETMILGGLLVSVGVTTPVVCIAGNFNSKLNGEEKKALSWMGKMRAVVEEEKGEGEWKNVEMVQN